MYTEQLGLCLIFTAAVYMTLCVYTFAHAVSSEVIFVGGRAGSSAAKLAF